MPVTDTKSNSKLTNFYIYEIKQNDKKQKNSSALILNPSDSQSHLLKMTQNC